MLFSELPFFVFFACYLAVHFALPARFRIYLIILGSTIFYAWWRVDYVWIPYALTVIAWVGGIWIISDGRARAQKTRFIIVIVSLFIPLAIAKYAHFFLSDVVGLIPGVAQDIGDVSWWRFGLPLGISFVTFTLAAYVIDVYRGSFPVERQLSKLLAYVLLFPHLIAGPILRPHELMPQLSRLTAAIGARFTLGLAIFALGLVKKLVFADMFAGAVDEVFAPGAEPTGWQYLLAIHGFSLQIYCDFSGYTDMAIGIAYLIRIRLPTNFRQPYAASSITDFWRRWHITLSFWLRDYLYIPLGGNRLGAYRRLINLMVTMLLGGLWHGAAWTFVFWGFLHGAGLIVAQVSRQLFKRIGFVVPGWLGVVLTFYFVTFSWVYFRAPDISTAHRVLLGPFQAPWGEFTGFAMSHLFELFLLAVFFLTHRYDSHARVRLAVRRWPREIVWPLVISMLIIAVAVSQGSSAKFIYFDF